MSDDCLQHLREVDALGTVVGVWAHPDDEAFLSAGLMALARAAGNRVVVVTATRGERGQGDASGFTPEWLGRLRSDELAASLAALDVVEHRWLGYVDGTCCDVPLDEGCRQLGRLFDRVQPDTVVTFGPDGMTGHGDHRAVSAWTTAVWESAGRQARLLYATTSQNFQVRFGDINEQFGVFPAGFPVTTPDDALALRLQLSGDFLDRKAEALRAHASQVAVLHQSVGHEAFVDWWAEESFRDASTQPVPDVRRAALIDE